MQPYADWSLRTKIFTGSLITLLIMLLTAARLYQALQVSREREAWVMHTYEVIGDAEALLLQWSSMQSSFRAYLLSGDQHFIDDYNNRLAVSQGLHNDLKHLVADNPPQVGRLEQLAQNAAVWHGQVISPATAQRASFGPNTTLAEFTRFEREGENARYFLQLNDGINQFLLVERSLLQIRSNESRQAASELQITLLLGTLLALASCGFLTWLVASNLARRVNRVADVATQIANGDLAAYTQLPQGKDEVGRMSAAFTHMASTIRQQIEVTEHARAETRAIFDATAEAMILIGTDQRVRSVNRRVGAMLGAEAGVITGAPMHELKPLMEKIFVDPSPIFELLPDPNASEHPSSTAMLTQSWPEARELELSAGPVSNEGQFIGMLYVLRDVTQQRAVERMKSEFVSMVSHELRTPLTSIKGYVSLLLEDEVGSLNEEQQEFLQIVQSNTDRQVALINALLDLTRIEAGKTELQPSAVNVQGIIDMVKMAFRPQLAAKQQTLNLEIAPNLPIILGDSDRLTQIVTNLLSNAHKYTPSGGFITIAAKRIDDRVRIDVRDTGIGMNAEEQAQLFTKFFRAKNRATQEASGTGLGLAITRALVELHGGTMEVTSAPGEGSCFSTILPIGDVPDQENPFVDIPQVQVGGRVLIVDDERDIAQLIRRYLDLGGYQTYSAGSGSEALQIARDKQPDLILLDIMLPDADGFTVLEWLKQDPVTTSIPVMMLSIVPDDGRGTLLGAVDYITKPVSRDHLLSHIRHSLAHGSGQRILVADDDTNIRALLVHHLKQAGYTVFEASDGLEAVELARGVNPNLVLLDVHMPNLDGVATLQALRAQEATRDLRVIMLSATPEAWGARTSAIEELGSILYRKPCSAEELALAIAQGLKQEKVS